MEIRRLEEFSKDLKSLQKRFPTLEEDLAVFGRVQLKAFHELGLDNGGIKQISGLGFSEPVIYKVKKFACRSLKGRGVQSGLRIIYAYFAEKPRVELVEIYFKADREMEDRERIKRYYK